jgi:hypothetical protein
VRAGPERAAGRRQRLIGIEVRPMGALEDDQVLT